MGRSRPTSYAKRIWRTTVSPYIRLKGCLDTTGTTTHGHCYTCARKNIPFAELEAGHCITKYGHAAVEFEEDNLRIQCNSCNDIKRGGGMVATFKANLIEEIGQQRWDRIFYLSKKVKFWTIEELREIKVYYEQKLADLTQAREQAIFSMEKRKILDRDEQLRADLAAANEAIEKRDELIRWFFAAYGNNNFANKKKTREILGPDFEKIMEKKDEKKD